MRKTTALPGLLAGCLLLVFGANSLQAATVADMLNFKPDFPDVQITTPTIQEYASCEMKWAPKSKEEPSSGSYLLLDARKQTVRRFVLVNGKYQSLSYYKDGVEVYREIYSTTNATKKQQYRWLNAGGMKWGISTKENGKIDQWKMISAEEAAHEVFTALASGDYARLQALFITEAELRTLPTAEAQRIAGLIRNASAKFQATRSKTPGLDAKAQFVRVESATPQCVLTEVNGTEQEQIQFPYRTVLFESSEKEKDGKPKHDFVQTGAMIKVGSMWRLVDGPGIGDSDPIENSNSPVLAKLYEDIMNLEKNPPPVQMTPAVNKAVQEYNLKRVAVINKILPFVQGVDKENWIKQKLDNLSAAYQAGDQASLVILGEQRDQFVKAAPGSEMAAFATYRQLWALFAPQLVNPTAQVQNKWLDELAKFAQSYPNAEDTPEALRLLATGCEYAGKDEEAKRWYQLLAKNFPNSPSAVAAEGAVRRLDLIGRAIALTGPQLGNGAAFNINNLNGKKLVVVYYWSSNVNVCAADFAKLKQLQAAHGKEVEFVTISLDDNPQTAAKFLQSAQLPAIHLFTPGGFSSPLATYYGINILPTMFLVGKDGRVIDRSLQANDLEIALRKAL